MKIKRIIEQHRRDFSAIMECQFCGHEEDLDCGYDDRYYHDHVIPQMKCKKCNKSTNSELSSGGAKPLPEPPTVDSQKDPRDSWLDDSWVHDVDMGAR